MCFNYIVSEADLEFWKGFSVNSYCSYVDQKGHNLLLNTMIVLREYYYNTQYSMNTGVYTDSGLPSTTLTEGQRRNPGNTQFTNTTSCEKHQFKSQSGDALELYEQKTAILVACLKEILRSFWSLHKH